MDTLRLVTELNAAVTAGTFTEEEGQRLLREWRTLIVGGYMTVEEATVQLRALVGPTTVDASDSRSFWPRPGGDKEVREKWLERYGVDIDDPHLRRRAAVKTTGDDRLELAAPLFARWALQPLEQVQAVFKRLLHKPLPGSSRSYTEIAQSEREGRSVLSALRSTPGRLFDMRLVALLEELEAFHAVTKELVLEAKTPTSRASDEAFGRAVYEVSEWCKTQLLERHRDTTGLWKDVETCLRFHGHDLGAVTPQTDRLRMYAARYAAANVSPQ
jgi:hypothetical protein